MIAPNAPPLGITLAWDMLASFASSESWSSFLSSVPGEPICVSGDNLKGDAGPFKAAAAVKSVF